MEPITGTPTETIQTEMDAVLQESVRVAVDYLTRFDTFIPFAVLYRADGQLEQIEVAPTDASVEVHSQDAYDALVAGIGDRAGDLHAVGVVSDVLVSRDEEAQGDAVRVELEHQDAGSRVIDAFVTYERGESGPPSFAEELRTSEGSRRIWV